MAELVWAYKQDASWTHPWGGIPDMSNLGRTMGQTWMEYRRKLEDRERDIYFALPAASADLDPDMIENGWMDVTLKK